MKTIGRPGNREVARFYDNFLGKKLVKDFENLNLRQLAAMRLLRRYLRRSDNVLELGCGAGIVTREIARRVARCTAVDISDANVALAESVVSKGNTEFFVFDLVEDDCGMLAERGPFDAVVMVDVIEHIPLGAHAMVIEKIEGLLAPGGRWILTYPTPQYQRLLYEKEPEKIQVVDEIVELPALLQKTKLDPVYYATMDVWRKEQYAHLVLQKPSADRLAPIQHRSIAWRMEHNIRARVWRYRNAGIVRRLST